MVFLRDEGSEFDAPLEEVWAFVGSGDHHSRAHRHEATSRVRHSESSGTYAWEQPFGEGRARFAMRWTSYWPLGIGYEVLEGPFQGSKFFLIYEPRGSTTAVSVVGEFVSPTLPVEQIESAALRFFSVEFDQDRAAIHEGRARRPSAP